MIRERSKGSYRVAPYFLAKSMGDIGMHIVAPIGYALMVYWCVGLRSDFAHFLIFMVLFMAEVRSDTECSATPSRMSSECRVSISSPGPMA